MTAIRTKTFETFPVEFHGFTLLEHLGGGCMSDVYLAQPGKDSNLPSRLCIKVAVNKLERYAKPIYPPEQALSTLAAQKKLQIAMGQHPFFVKTFPAVFPDRPDIMALELGCCSLEALQFALGQGSKGHFHPITVKYFAAQAFLMLHHLHSKGLLWADPKQGNMIVFPDFSVRAIDVGHGAPMTDDKAKRCDFLFTAGFLLSLSTSSDEWNLFDNRENLVPLVTKYANQMSPELSNLVDQLMNQTPFEQLLGHSYWITPTGADQSSCIDLRAVVGNEVAGLATLRVAAWKKLPKVAKQFFISRKGIDVVAQ